MGQSPAALLTTVPRSAQPLLTHYATCSRCVPPGKPDPAAHTLLPPSTLPAAPPPSPAPAPDISPPAPPAPLPTPGDGAPAYSPARSAPHSSARHLHTPLPPSPASCAPAPRTTRGRTSPLGTWRWCHSTHRALAAAPPPPAAADEQASAAQPPPSLPAACGNNRHSAPSSPVQTTPWRTPVHPRSARPPPSRTASARTSTLRSPPLPAAPPPAPAVQVCLLGRSARQTPPGTAGCGPGSAPAARAPPPAQTGCPDAAARRSLAPSPAPALPPPSANPPTPP